VTSKIEEAETRRREAHEGFTKGSKDSFVSAFVIFVTSCLCLLTSVSCGEVEAPDAIWGRAGREAGEMIYPRAIARSPVDGSLFVIDRVAHIQRFDPSGQPLNGWVMPEWGQGKPVGLTVDTDGNLWVPDTHYHRVIVFTPDGREIRRFGSKGSGPGEFDLPTDVAFDSAGNVYVSEYGQNNRIQVFDRDLKYLRGWGQMGQGDGDLARPQSIAIVDDLLYVADSCNHRIAVFGLDGTFVRNLGRSGSGPGEYRFPYGLEADAEKQLIVTEFGNGRVQKIERATGAHLATWGRTGRLAGELNYPWAATQLADGRVVVCDAGNNRLQVFRFR
jgi:DNA-binding beta-propeller fold protein YncE